MKKRKNSNEPARPAAEHPVGKGAHPPSRHTQEKAFNRWLSERLRKKYDPVLEEKIPDEILELLRQDRRER